MSVSLKRNAELSRMATSKCQSSALSDEKRHKFFGTSSHATLSGVVGSIDTSCSLMQKLHREPPLKYGYSLIPEIKKPKILEKVYEKKKEVLKRKLVESERKPTKMKTLKVKKKTRAMPEKKAHTKVKKIMKVAKSEAAAVERNLDYDYTFERLETTRKQEDEFGEIEMVGEEEVEDDKDKGATEVDSLPVIKKHLLDLVSVSLLKPLNVRNPDLLRPFLFKADLIADLDPEFILKLALYSRKHLNIRQISNFLLAYASTNDKCKCFLAKYFNQSVILPTDWTEVTELSLTLRCQKGTKMNLPPVLRRVLVDKFPDFDEYQLGKYNKTKLKAQDPNDQSPKAKFTLKQLIRKLHISQPVQHVLSILGKRYPSTMEDFDQSRLPGDFDSDKAGTRMKLAIPETWETQVSMKGNKAEVWGDLIDHKKLPFMAMLRNIRNMLLAGVEERHHKIILKRLSDENSVINSKQSPFRFLSAYTVLKQLATQKKNAASKELKVAQKKFVRGRKPMKPKVSKGLGQKLQNLDHSLIKRYEKALDRALEISTTNNITPIPGVTLIFVDLSCPTSLRSSCSNKNFGTANTVGRLSALLGLMCQRGCERGRLLALGTGGLESFEGAGGLILEDVQPLLNLSESVNLQGDVPRKEELRHIGDFFDDVIISKKQVNNLVFMDNSHNSKMISALTNSCTKYRHLSNRQLSCYHICINDSSTSEADDEGLSKDWVRIRGLSDQLLRFIAENGDSAQLKFVENIDKLYDLKNTPYLDRLKKLTKKTPAAPPKPLMLPRVPKWTTCRVFISSTFLDMFSERDLLVRHVFDELKRRGRGLLINVVEVDLRWGITEEDSSKNDALELCLSEVLKSEFFIGMLGERYGRGLEEYGQAWRREGMEWLESFPPGASLTHLEIQQCIHSIDLRNKAFFYFRNPAFFKDVPKEHRDKLVDEGGRRLRLLKSQVKSSGAEVFDGYPCTWGGVNEENHPIIHGLEEFGARVLDNVWNAIVQSRQEHLCVVNNLQQDDDDLSIRRMMTSSLMESLRSRFKGRAKLLSECVAAVQQHHTGVVVMAGKPGSGKSSLMASLVARRTGQGSSHDTRVLVHFVGAYPGSGDVMQLMRFLCIELLQNPHHTPPEQFDALCLHVRDLLKSVTSHRLLIFIDGVDQLDDCHNAKSLSWLPEDIPKNVLVVVSTCNNDETFAILKKRSSLVATIEIKDMELSDRMEMVRSVFKTHSKKLQETAFNNQLRTLVQKRESTSPLYLSLACEEVRKFGNFDQLSKKLSQLPATVSSLVTEVLEGAEKEYGGELVKVVLCCLYCSRTGLKEDELSSLVGTHMQLSPLPLEHIDSFHIIVETLSFSSSSSSSFFLLSSAKVLSFLHSIRNFLKPTLDLDTQCSIDNSTLKDIIHRKYLSSQAGKKVLKACHLLLAHLFSTQADPAGNLSWKDASALALSELPYHLLQGQDLTAWHDLMVDWRFMRARLASRQGKMMVQEYLMSDVNLPHLSVLNKRLIEKLTEGKAFKDYRDFVMKHCHTLSMHPGLLEQQILMQDEDNSVKRHASDSLHGVHQVFLWRNKHLFNDACVHTLPTPSQIATCMCLSKDNSLLAVGFDDVIIRIYNTTTFQVTGTLIGHSSDVTDMCFVGSRRLCSASKDNTLSLWDVDRSYRVAVLNKHQRAVSGCVCDGAGRVLVSVGLDARALLWHGATGDFEGTLARENSAINCVTMHPEARFVIIGLWKGTLHLYDLLERSRKAVFRGHAYSITCVSFDQSGDFVTSADLAGEVRTWNVAHGCTVSQFKGHNQPIKQLSFCQHNLITASDDSLIKVSSGKAGRCVGVVGGTGGVDDDEEEEEEVAERRATCLSISQHSSYLMVATGFHDGRVSMHSFHPDALLWSKRLTTTDVAVSSISMVEEGGGSKRGVFVGRQDGSIFLLDACKGHTEHQFQAGSCRISAIAVAYSGSSNDSSPAFAICASDDRLVYLFDLSTLQCPSQHKKQQAFLKLSAHEGTVSGVCVSPSQQLFASVGYDMQLVVWSLKVAGHKEHVMHHAHSDWLTCCAWSTQEDFLVTGSLDFTLKVWQVEEGGLVERTRLTGHLASVSAVDYKFGCIVSCSTNGELKVWSHKGVLITSIQSHKQRCNDVGLLVHLHQEGNSKKPVGNQNSTENDGGKEDDEKEYEGKATKKKEKGEEGEDDDEKESMDEDEEEISSEFEKGKEVEKKRRKKEVQKRGVKDIYVVTCSDDSSTKLWKPLESEEKATLIGHVGGVTSLVAGMEGLVCSGGEDGCLKVWRVMEQVGRAARNSVDAVAVASNPSKSIACVAYSNGGLTFWSERRRECGGVEYVSKEFQVCNEAITAVIFIDDNFILISTARKRLLFFRLHHKKSDSFAIDFLWAETTRELLTSLTMLQKSTFTVEMGELRCMGVVAGTGPSGKVLVMRLQAVTVQISTLKTQNNNSHLLSSTNCFSYNSFLVISGSTGNNVVCFLRHEADLNNMVERMVTLETKEWMCSVGAGEIGVCLGDVEGRVWMYGVTEGGKGGPGGDLKECLQPKLVFKAHEKRVLSLLVVGSLLLTASEDLYVKAWDMENNKQLGQFEGVSPVTGMALLGEQEGRVTVVCSSRSACSFVLQWIK